MPVDSSLTDFATDRSDDSRDRSRGGGERSSTDEATDATGSVDPIETTYEWNPGETVCAACGERTTHRWRTDDGLVCVDCKVW